MLDLELSSPEITPDLNLKMRIRILAQVILELTKACGKDCEDSISKGIVDRQIIENITLSFVDYDSIIRGQVLFCIDWERLEFLAKSNDDVTLIDRLDLKQLLSPQLDPVLYVELSNHVKKLKTKHNIKYTKASFLYRDFYRSNSEIKKTMEYLGHIDGESLAKNTEELNYELKVAFQGLDGYLDIILRS